MRVSLSAMRPILLGHTLDLDSTVFCRYGTQDGSLKGHNPIKHGRPSHHPLVAWLSERRRLLWATLRAGHAGTANGAREFLAHALTMLPTGHQIGMVRADSGFFVTAFLEALEARDLPYIIVARLTPLLRNWSCTGLRRRTGGWWSGASRWLMCSPRCRPGEGRRAGLSACARPWPSTPTPGGGA